MEHVEHTFHIRHFGYVPIVEQLVEGTCVLKHLSHSRYFRHVPFVERLVEGPCFIKHTIHIRHIGHVPSKKNFVLHFNMSFDESGIFTGIFPGGQTSLCAPPNCQIQAVNSVVGIHTHPVGERVSSADLVTAIKLHPEMNRQNKRRLTVRGIGDMRRANLLGDRQFLDLVGIMLL